ncbi:MAG: HDIG domain-containing protein [Myxococcota bacterium]
MSEWLGVMGLIAGWGAGIATLGAQRRRVRQRLYNTLKAQTAAAQAKSARLRLEAAKGRLDLRQRLEATALAERKRWRDELEVYEDELTDREMALQGRHGFVEALRARVKSRGAFLAQQGDDDQQTIRDIERLQQCRQQELERRAEQSGQDVASRLVAEWVGRSRLHAQGKVRRTIEETEQNGTLEARRVMALAVDRYNGVGHLERIQNNFVVPDVATFAAFADPEGATHQAFIETVGGELWIDEPATTLTVRGDDPLGREVARRALQQIINRKIHRPDRVRSVVQQVRGDIEREVQNAGRKAGRILEVGKMHPDVLHLVGRLKFRLSYSQNQWKHAIEVGYLSGMMAIEMGQDVKKARRGGLLHDIGKAMTHDHEGSHAVLGAEVARLVVRMRWLPMP